MKSAPCLAFALAMGLAACEGPQFPPPQFQGHAPVPGTAQQPGPPDEYHSGYDIGSRDASYGYPADARRAMERFGNGSEATFSEGYADGYEHRAPRR